MSEQAAQTSGAATSKTAKTQKDAALQADAQQAESFKPRKRRLIGRVASDKMHQTFVLEVVRYKMDRMYKKYVKVRKRYQVHDENNECRVGDRVEVIEHAPISKHKRWKLLNVIERAPQDL